METANGFYYPPAFHSQNLFFDKVPIRHYVVEPSFADNQLFKTDLEAAKNRYCNFNNTVFNNFSDIDRQTELNDDDGSLTGLINTISINEDVFFGAPVETAECKGNFGVSPSLACPKAKPPTPSTARTSPYDYIVTVVAPGCSQNDPPKKPDGETPYGYGRCGDNPDNGSGGTRWSSDCANPSCYGVPLYRQLLTSDEQKRWDDFKCTSKKGAPECRWPFIRMSGFNIYQRHTLTLNGGTYYLDTSVPLNTQRNEKFTDIPVSDVPRGVNVFEGAFEGKPQTYYVFFLYAKPSTKQTYQIYVGDKQAIIKPVRANLASGPIMFKDGVNSPKWLTWGEVKDKVLTVTVDFTLYGNELNPKNILNGQCGPETFCKWGTGADAGNCVSKANNPQLLANKNLKDEVDAACRNWAVKDLDCPSNGCFGFSFTLDKDFKTGDGLGQLARPTPQSFPPPSTRFVRTTTDPDNKSQPDAKTKIELECYYPKLPPECGPPIDR